MALGLVFGPVEMAGGLLDGDGLLLALSDDELIPCLPSCSRWLAWYISLLESVQAYSRECSLSSKKSSRAHTFRDSR
jgi:hypothetical protein